MPYLNCIAIRTDRYSLKGPTYVLCPRHGAILHVTHFPEHTNVHERKHLIVSIELSYTDLTTDSRAAIARATEVAMRRAANAVEPLHLLWGC